MKAEVSVYAQEQTQKSESYRDGMERYKDAASRVSTVVPILHPSNNPVSEPLEVLTVPCERQPLDNILI